jgi:hypothetical protein
MLPHDLAGEPVVVRESVRNDWHLREAASDASPGNLLPSRVAWHALSGTEGRFALVLDALASVGYRPQRPDVARAAKWDGTTRPVCDLPVEDQVIYAALVALLRSEIPADFVTYTGAVAGAHSSFEQFPLAEAGGYVLEADAAAFYQYIDHERLAYELIGLTGRADAVEPLLRFIEAWVGAPRGIPQGPAASNALADIYIASASRALERAGYEARRYSDDFRVVGGTWAQLKRAQDVLESAFHELGLVLAPGKLRIVKLETYRAWIEKANDPRLANATIRDAVMELGPDDYFDESDPDLTDVTTDEVTRAEAVFRDQITTDHVDPLSTRLLRRALSKLGRGQSPRALDDLPRLLTRYAHLTPAVATYLKSLSGTPHEVRATSMSVRWLMGRSYRSPWQVGWILNSLAYAEHSDEGAAEVALKALLSDHLPWFARGQAALAIAVHGQIPRATDFVEIYERAPRATRPDLIAAVKVADPSWADGFVNGAAVAPLLDGVAHLANESFRDWI